VRVAGCREGEGGAGEQLLTACRALADDDVDYSDVKNIAIAAKADANFETAEFFWFVIHACDLSFCTLALL
jgi:hypothetical protein